MDLAEKITGPLEEALTVAFSQVQPSHRQDGGVMYKSKLGGLGSGALPLASSVTLASH